MITFLIKDEMYTFIETTTEEEWKYLRNLLSYKERVFVFGKMRYERKYLLHGKSKFTSTGLVPFIIKNIYNKFPFLIKDERIKNEKIKFNINYQNFEEYQKDIINQLLENKRGIVYLPTGAGKSYIISHLVTSTNEKSIIITPSTEILNQIKEAILKINKKENIFVLHSKELDNQEYKIILTTGQTLYSRFEKYSQENVFKSYRLTIWDECHMLTADSFFKVAHLFRNSDYFWGFSATPKRKEEKDLRITAIFDDVLITTNKPITRVLPVKIVFIKYPQSTNIFQTTTLKQTNDEYLLLLLDKNRIFAIEKLVNKLKKENLSFLIFVDRIELGETLSNLLNVPFINGQTKNRTELFKKIDQKKILGCVSSIGFTGLDIPTLNCIINTSRIATHVNIVQKTGRVRRKSENKFFGIVFDFYDEIGKYKQWYKNRKKIYETINKEIEYVEIL